jgi:hypothetical protein
VCRSRAGAPVSEENTGGNDKAMFPWKPRGAYKKESTDGVAGAGFLATADDFSLVKLFSYPVVADDAPYRAYRGHASHVTCVRFSSDDRKVCLVFNSWEQLLSTCNCWDPKEPDVSIVHYSTPCDSCKRFSMFSSNLQSQHRITQSTGIPPT